MNEAGRVSSPCNAMRCFDCAKIIATASPLTRSSVAQCPACEVGMLLAYVIDGETVNAGYWPEEEDDDV